MSTIVLTRPIGQSHRLGELLKEQLPGLEQIQLPLLSIVPNEDQAEAQRLRALLTTVDLAIFVSPNAIECGMRLWGADWPKNLPIAVIGGGSADALERRGITKEHNYQIYFPKDPEHWDSEGLWAELSKTISNWKGKKILFLKGAGGREWLGEQFLNHGAEIYQVSTYRRVPLAIDAPVWQSLQKLNPKEVACLITSSEALQHMVDVFRQQSNWTKEWFNLATMICSHERIAKTARDAGFKQVELCAAGDQNLLAASQRWLEQIK